MHHPFLTPRLAAILAFTAAAPFASAQATLTDLGVLPGTEWSIPGGISGDGGTVVGVCDGTVAFRWTSARGMEALGALPGDEYALPWGASYDGSVITGASSATQRGFMAFTWSEAGGMRPLGTLPGWLESVATGISGNGTDVVGYCLRHEDGFPTLRAFIWSAPQGMRDLGTFPGGTYSFAVGISLDGGFVCGGSAVPPDDYSRPFRWTPSTGISLIGVGPCGEGSSAHAISGDGSVIVGDDYCPDLTTKGFRWRSGGGVDAIPPLEGLSEALIASTNRDGSIVAGYSYKNDDPSPPRAILWTQRGGTVDLAELLERHGVDLTGWVLRDATGMSQDNLAVVGYAEHDGRGVAYRAQLPCPFVVGPDPAPQVCTNGTAEFTVEAVGSGPVAYQWRKDGVNLANSVHISGVRTGTLRVAMATPASEGLYDCVVTGACGTTNSAAAALVVCSGDFNCDGGIDGADLDSFFSAWEDGADAADVNRDGGVDGADVQEFFVRWEAGAC